MVEKRTMLIIALLIALAITSTGWALSESKPKNTGSLPEGIYSWTEYFHGYQAYLDQGIFSSILRSTSMSPTFRMDDVILWIKAEPSELKVGDIIIFRHPTLPDIDNVVHRIVDIQFDGGKYSFRTKGDNFADADRFYVPEANIHGLVIGVVYHDNLR